MADRPNAQGLSITPLHRHGEVFVLDDGGEADLDLGNYERYLNITLTRENNITTGKVYLHVIERERKGSYLGKTIQVVPHITDAIQDWIERVARIPVDDTGEEPDVCVIELGGTVGDIESMPFVEALRQLRRRAGRNNFLLIHVSYIPVINGEQKTKPTQHAVKDVRSAGLAPDLVSRPSLLLQSTAASLVSRARFTYKNTHVHDQTVDPRDRLPAGVSTLLSPARSRKSRTTAK